MTKYGIKLLSLLLAATLALSLAACSSAQAGSTNTQDAPQSVTSTEQAPGGEAAPGENAPSDGRDFRFDGTPGKITSIDGATVTVALGELSGGPVGMPVPPGGKQQGDGKTPPAPSDGNQQLDGKAPPSPPSDTDKGDRSFPGPGFTESGETLTLDLSLITKDGKAVTSEDLSEGDLLLLTLDDSGAATEAKLLSGGPKDLPQGAPSEEGSTSAGESGAEQAEGSANA